MTEPANEDRKAAREWPGNPGFGDSHIPPTGGEENAFAQGHATGRETGRERVKKAEAQLDEFRLQSRLIEGVSAAELVSQLRSELVKERLHVSTLEAQEVSLYESLADAKGDRRCPSCLHAAEEHKKDTEQPGRIRPPIDTEGAE